jgi:ribosomal 30S subunit maturation factor RimM
VTLPPGERITVGQVRGLHGLRGAVRVELLSDEPDRFAVGSVLYADGDDRPMTVAWTGGQARLIVRFHELTDRPSVESLRSAISEVVPATPLPPETWYWHQIEGLEARTGTARILGTVSDVFRAGRRSRPTTWAAWWMPVPRSAASSPSCDRTPGISSWTPTPWASARPPGRNGRGSDADA